MGAFFCPLHPTPRPTSPSKTQAPALPPSGPPALPDTPASFLRHLVAATWRPLEAEGLHPREEAAQQVWGSRGRRKEEKAAEVIRGLQTPTCSRSLPLGRAQNDLGASCSATLLTLGWPPLGSSSGCRSPSPQVTPRPGGRAISSNALPRDLRPGGGQGSGESGRTLYPAATLASGTRQTTFAHQVPWP